MRELSKVVAWGAVVLSLLAGCGGANSKVDGAKSATGEKQFEDDPIALLPSSALLIVSVDARALYASGSIGGQLGKLTERIVPIGEEAGFVASRDLDRVVVGAYSMQGADVAAVLIGKFDEQKIALAAQNRAPMKGGGVLVTSQYGGRTLYTLSNAGFTVLSARAVLAGTESGIRRAIDRMKDGHAVRDQLPWMLSTLDTPGAAFAAVADFANQPIGAASVGMIPLPWAKGLKAARIVGNFHDPGLNIAGTVTYPDGPRAEAAAAELRKTAAAASMLTMLGVPQLRNLEIKTAQTDTQVTFAVDDQQLRQFLQTASQYMPQ